MSISQTAGKKIYNFALFLLFALIPIIVLYMSNNSYSLDAPIDNGKFGTFGDFVGGVLGSIWSLCGVLLFYTALIEQRADFKTNSDALAKQVDALNMQTEEFILQREELKQSRQVFIEQSKTLMQQRLESTYFSLLNIYNKILSELNDKNNNSYFKELKVKIHEEKIIFDDPLMVHDASKATYLDVFYDHKEELSHYFKLLYRIIKIIDDSDIEPREKFRYIKILRSQLSENEMLAIYYNSHSYYGGESYRFILKYNLLKHLPSISKLSFKKYFIHENSDSISQCIDTQGIDTQAGTVSKKIISCCLRFNNEIIRLLRNFEVNLFNNMHRENFEMHRESYELPLCEGVIIELESCEMNELTIKISSDLSLEILLNFSKDVFVRYLNSFLYDIYIFSKYISVDSDKDFIVNEINENEIVFKLSLSTKLEINRDIE